MNTLQNLVNVLDIEVDTYVLSQLAIVYCYFEKEKWTKAVLYFEKQDVFVRQKMPRSTYTWMYERFEATRT